MRSESSNEPSLDTRERFLRAAAVLLDERGYSGTRLAEIAEIADVRTSATYHYFRSREALIEEVVLLGQNAITDHVADRLSRLEDSVGSLDRVAVAVAAHLEIALSTPGAASASLRVAGQLPAAARQSLAGTQRSYGELWRGLLASLADEGLLARGIDVGTAYLLVIGALNFAPQWKVSGGSEKSVDVESFQRFVLRALSGSACERAGAREVPPGAGEPAPGLAVP
ncbi:TetR/AcrR family transcriptional regulator [Actinomycetospora endophytica]|uniref:TetR/AcrR family transcriptional regulator n=1 Tax=Actinomycetospora endophytica TaxID=2291215 RepID=A0ABS8PIM3_9PSEU|nr:TetR/AcrR family transcriptional regulator [Actinomycetospora endophytica]MCD2197345.1 TetR/AcrR family transcriptional regulator [Actinomycetospora endophytica]